MTLFRIIVALVLPLCDRLARCQSFACPNESDTSCALLVLFSTCDSGRMMQRNSNASLMAFRRPTYDQVQPISCHLPKQRSLPPRRTIKSGEDCTPLTSCSSKTANPCAVQVLILPWLWPHWSVVIGSVLFRTQTRPVLVHLSLQQGRTWMQTVEPRFKCSGSLAPRDHFGQRAKKGK